MEQIFQGSSLQVTEATRLRLLHFVRNDVCCYYLIYANRKLQLNAKKMPSA